MHLEGATVGPLRQLTEPLLLELGAVNVLYGANGSGKSTILECLAARTDAAAHRRSRRSWLRPGELSPPATYFFRLSERDRVDLVDMLELAGFSSAMKDLVGDEHSAVKDNIVELAKDELRLGPADVEEPRIDLGHVDPGQREHALVEALLADVSGPEIPLAQKFAWGLLAEPLVAVQGQRCWLAAAAADSQRLGVEKIAATPTLLGTWVQRASHRLLFESKGFARLIRLGPPSAALTPNIAWLDGDPVGIEEELEGMVPALFDAYWGAQKYSKGELTWDRRGTESDLDRWLDDEEFDGLQLRQTLAPVLERVAALANELAPAFVRVEGTIVVRARPIGTWGKSGRRLALLIEFDGPDHYWPEADLGAGHRAWIAIAVREACRLVLQLKPRTVMNCSTGDIWEAENDTVDVVEEAVEGGGPVEYLSVQDWHDPPTTVVLLDEPEAHLHPAAVKDVGTSLVDLARRNRTVVVATHAHQLLDLPTQLLRAWRVHVERGSTTADIVSTDLLEGLRRLSGDLGLRPSDILGMTRAVLLVEGKHDELILNSCFGAELAQNRILILPIRGTHNARAIAEGEFVARAGIELFVLFDNTAPLAGAPVGARSPETEALEEMLQLLEERGTPAHAVPYEDPDIIAALPEAAVRRAFPEARPFTWARLIEMWRALRKKPNFKAFAMVQLGLAPHVHPTTFIESVLASRLDDELPRPTLRRSVSEILAMISN